MAKILWMRQILYIVSFGKMNRDQSPLQPSIPLTLLFSQHMKEIVLVTSNPWRYILETSEKDVEAF